jgi:hypothetical protein
VLVSGFMHAPVPTLRTFDDGPEIWARVVTSRAFQLTAPQRWRERAAELTLGARRRYATGGAACALRTSQLTKFEHPAHRTFVFVLVFVLGLVFGLGLDASAEAPQTAPPPQKE